MEAVASAPSETRMPMRTAVSTTVMMIPATLSHMETRPKLRARGMSLSSAALEDSTAMKTKPKLISATPDDSISIKQNQMTTLQWKRNTSRSHAWCLLVCIFVEKFPRSRECAVSTHLPWTKWPPLRKRYFQTHFCEWKFCILIEIYLSLFLMVQIAITQHGPLTRYVKSRVAHAPGMPGTFPPAAEFKGKRELAIPACITARASRTCRDACRDCLPAVAGKTFPAFLAHAHPQFDVFGKRPIGTSHYLNQSSSDSLMHECGTVGEMS